MLGLLSSRRKSGKKELDWSSTGAACRALSVCASHSVQHRKNMGEMDKGDLLKRLVKTAAEAERATENERAMMRAQSRPRMDDGGKAPPPVQQSVGLASLLLWSVLCLVSCCTLLVRATCGNRGCRRKWGPAIARSAARRVIQTMVTMIIPRSLKGANPPHACVHWVLPRVSSRPT